MTTNDRETYSRCAAGRRLSRRRALAAGGSGIAAIALQAAGARMNLASAQNATPAPDLGGAAPLPLTGERLAAFEAYVAAKLAETKVPGASVAVVQGGETALLQGFGVRELGRPEPVTADTLLRIGSVTKSFSSLLTATLVDAGRLSWETPLVDLLPDFAVADPTLTPRLTVSDAFCACSGLPRRDFEFVFNANSLTPEKLIANMATLPLTAAYGEKYQYSNQMVAAGGFAAAVADGGSPDDLGAAYAIALRERVLNPIGMPRTTDILAEVAAGDDYAVPHADDIAGALHPLPLLEDDAWLAVIAPSGALWSSAREMAHYVQTELNRGVSPDGTRLVSTANLERTWAPGVAFPPAPAGTPPEQANLARHYGLGWVIGSFAGQRLIWHSGGTLGFSALAMFLPDADLGVVALTNGAAGAAAPFTYAVTMRLFELAFDQPAAFDAQLETGLAAAAQARAALLAQLGQPDSAAVRPYLGTYANSALGLVTLSLRAGKLIFQAGVFRTELRPRLDAAGAVTDYVPVDPPLAGVPPQFTVRPELGGDSQPRLTVTVALGDPGEPDVVYPFAPVGAAATPTP